MKKKTKRKTKTSYLWRALVRVLKSGSIKTFEVEVTQQGLYPSADGALALVNYTVEENYPFNGDAYVARLTLICND